MDGLAASKAPRRVCPWAVASEREADRYRLSSTRIFEVGSLPRTGLLIEGVWLRRVLLPLPKGDPGERRVRGPGLQGVLRRQRTSSLLGLWCQSGSTPGSHPGGRGSNPRRSTRQLTGCFGSAVRIPGTGYERVSKTCFAGFDSSTVCRGVVRPDRSQSALSSGGAGEISATAARRVRCPFESKGRLRPSFQLGVSGNAPGC